MLETIKEWQLFFMGMAIGGNREKIKQKSKEIVIEDTSDVKVEESEHLTSIKI